MSNFNKAYDLILEDIIQSVTPEELKDRQDKYPKIMLKNVFDEMLKTHKMVENLDGTYDVDGHVDITHEYLTSLTDIPYKLNSVFRFDCSYNMIENLIGSPKIVKGLFDCSFNNLTSLEGCPEKVYGDFIIENEEIDFKEEDIRKVCKVGGKIFV